MNSPDRPASSSHSAADAALSLKTPSGPIGLLLRLFSSIWFGVILLVLLFIYSSVGSSGVPKHINILDPAHWESVRQLSFFEMTEFEWFHWWPFNLLIALICINIIVATVRRIPFNAVNLGVWMIHAGIIILALGSVWYFATKVEGDTPVIRRRVVVELPGQPPVSMAALPGNQMVVSQGDNAYLLQVQGIDPTWEIRSGEDVGKKAYSVSIAVQSKTGRFVRQLLAGYPQYTEDVIRTNDPKQPMARAIKALGKPLVDEAIKMSLEYMPQKHFYLADSSAVYLRELDAAGQPKTDWIQRPIKGLPRYNDRIALSDDVWQMPDDPALSVKPVKNVSVPPTDPNDPLPSVTFNVSRYLRYATLSKRRLPAPEGSMDPTVSPAASIRLLAPSGESQNYDLVAFDPIDNAALQGNLLFSWVDSQQALDRLKQRVDPMIRFTVPGQSTPIEEPILKTMRDNPDLPFTPIAGTEYSYRVEMVQDNLRIGEKLTSVAVVQIRTPQRDFKRWVFDDPTQNRDMAMAAPGSMAQHDAMMELDQSIQTVYRPGQLPPAPIMVLAGPGENDLAVMVTKSVGQPRFQSVKIGDPVEITEGVQLVIDKFMARTIAQTKPLVVPREQRDREVRENLSLIGLDVPTAGGSRLVWLPYHYFAFSRPEEVLRRFPYRPQVISLPDGRRIEMMFSRARLPLPAPVVLDDFHVASHIGGFTGQTSSILNWTSVIRFERDMTYGHPLEVSANNPGEHDGYWFFQAQWDPPDQSRFEGDPGSRGLNYSVLGVGNRNGVYVQIAGCVIAVLGMIYAFYVKPVIKRRRQQAVYANLAATKREANSPWGERHALQPLDRTSQVES